MCFSAGASFASGAVISAIGVAAFKEVHKPSQRVFAGIPILFGIQQLAEGCLWLSLSTSDFMLMRKLSTYTFLITAQMLWAFIIPLSILLLEENPRRKKILRVMLCTGILLSLYYAFYLFFFKVTSQIIDCHILYVTQSPQSRAIPTFIIYLGVTIGPFFISGIKKMYLLGIVMALSCLGAVVFYKLYLTSVWCFFAAIISVFIYLILRQSRKSLAN